jgi:pyruvate ferredoxin oxidoreductase gamma subunit
MDEIRIHGLGGDGVVRLSEMIGLAAITNNKWASSFPVYGTEIRGAAVKAFTRVDDKRITIRSYIYEPDFIILLNDVLLEHPDVLQGISENTVFLANMSCDNETVAHLRETLGCEVIVIDATAMAIELIGRPITNTIMLGAFNAISELFPLETLETVIRENLPPAIADKNIQAMHEGYKAIKEMKA